jgi:hypothetical protein
MAANTNTSRDDAARIARDLVMSTGLPLPGFDPVFTVRTLAEVVESGSRAPVLYGPEHLHRSVASSWIVYVSQPRPFVLKSSEIVVVSKTGGAVLYWGSADDEG